MRKHVVVLSGAGISAESGLRTFRDGDGLWEDHRVEDVATPEAWARDPELVLRFYNERRRQVVAAEPNAAHLALVELERDCQVTIITQNIDDLHERAGSSQVLHLHGEILQARSSADEALRFPTAGADIHLGDLCPLGSQLRPHVVWFGESVPAMEQAVPHLAAADALLIVGTSLVVYPAASLVQFAPIGAQVFLVDPQDSPDGLRAFTHFQEAATSGVPKVVELLRTSE